MINYTKRLDKTLKELVDHQTAHTVDFANDLIDESDFAQGEKLFIYAARSALTQLFRDMVKEAKPAKGIVVGDSEIYDEYDSDRELLRHELQENNINFGKNQALYQFESNLLTMLGEKE